MKELVLQLIFCVIYITSYKADTSSGKKADDYYSSAENYKLSGDIKSALSFYKKSAELNNTDAINALGEIYMIGMYGTEIDYDQAEKYFRKAAFYKNPKALYNLAMAIHYKLIKSSTTDSAEEIKLLYVAASLGNHDAILSLGNKHRFGYGVPNSCKSALSYYGWIASEVIKSYQNFFDPLKPHLKLSTLNYENHVDKETIDYFKISAYNGDTVYQVAYGKLLMQRIQHVNSEDDIKEAFIMFKSAASEGNAEAIEILGQFYLRGIYVDKDFNTAFKLFNQSANKGYMPSHNRLGRMYNLGQGRNVDTKKAREHFEISASSSDPEGLFELANMNSDSKKPISINNKQMMFRRSASSGYAPAMYVMAKQFSYGNSNIPSCTLSLDLFLLISQKFRPAQSEFETAFQRYSEKDYHHSLLLYMDLAYKGYKTAQSNAAYILETYPRKIKNFGKKIMVEDLSNETQKSHRMDKNFRDILYEERVRRSNNEHKPSGNHFNKYNNNSFVGQNNITENMKKREEIKKNSTENKKNNEENMKKREEIKKNSTENKKNETENTKKREEIKKNSVQNMKISTENKKNETENKKKTEKIKKNKSSPESTKTPFSLFTDPYCNSMYYFYSLASDQGDTEAKRKLADYHISNDSAESNALLFSHQSYYLYKSLVARSWDFDYKSDGFFAQERLLVAYELYKEASFYNDAQSTYNLGYMHHHGIGVRQNFEKAKEYYAKSVKKNQRSFLPVKVQEIIIYVQINYILQLWKLVQVYEGVESVVLYSSLTSLVCLVIANIYWVCLRQFFFLRR